MHQRKIKFLKFIIVALTLFNALVSTAEVVCRQVRFSRLIDQNAGRSHSMKTDNSSIERVEDFKHLGTTLTNQNYV